MDPSLAELFDMLHRRFDEFEARWDRRFLEPCPAPEQRPLRTGAPSQIDAGVVADNCDNWGGLFEATPVPEEGVFDSTTTISASAPSLKEQHGAAVIADNWGGLFEQADRISEERGRNLSADVVFAGNASSGQRHDNIGLASTNSVASAFEEPVRVAEERDDERAASDPASHPPVMELLTLDAAATEEMEPEVYLLQIQELEKPSPRTPASGKEFEALAINGVQISSADKLVAPDVLVHDPSALHPPRFCRPWRPPSLRRPRRFPPRSPRPRRRRRVPPRPPWLLQLRRTAPRWPRLRRPRRVPPRRRGRPPRLPDRGCRPRLRARAWPRARPPEQAPRGHLRRRRLHLRFPDTRLLPAMSSNTGLPGLLSASATRRASPRRCSTLGRSHNAHVVIVTGGKPCVHDSCIDVTDTVPTGALARFTSLVLLDSTHAARAVKLSATEHAEVQRHHIHPYKATACKREPDLWAWDAEAERATQLDRAVFAVLFVATGAKAERFVPDFVGARDFIGSTSHVSEYKCGEASHDKRVLVVSGRNSDMGSCDTVLLLLGKLGVGNSLCAAVRAIDLDILVCCLAFCLGGYHAHGYSSNTEGCRIRKAKYAGIRLKLYSDGMIQLHAHLGRGYFVTTLLAWTVLLEARQSFEEKMNSMYLCFYRKPMANLLLVLTLEDPSFLGLLLCNSCLADWSPTKCSTLVCNSLKRRLSASIAVSMLGKFDRMLKRYISDFTHAYSIGVDIFYLASEIHGIQREFGTWISQCPVQFWPFSALLVVKAPWSPFTLLEIKGDAVHPRPLPWPFFCGFAAPVQSCKKPVPQLPWMSFDPDPWSKFDCYYDHKFDSLQHATLEFPRGTFTFVDAEGSIQDGSAHCIGGLLSVVVEEMQLGIECHGVLLTIIKSDGCTCQVAGNGRGGSVNIGDLHADEEREFLITLGLDLVAVPNRPPWPPPNQLEILCVEVHYEGKLQCWEDYIDLLGVWLLGSTDRYYSYDLLLKHPWSNTCEILSSSGKESLGIVVLCIQFHLVGFCTTLGKRHLLLLHAQRQRGCRAVFLPGAVHRLWEQELQIDALKLTKEMEVCNVKNMITAAA